MKNKNTLSHLETEFSKLIALVENDDFLPALKICEQILSVAPGAHGVYFYIALIHHRMGRDDLAYEAQLIGIKIYPDDAKYHYNAATYASSNNQDLVAMMHYERCLHIQPDNVDALWNYSELLRLDGHVEMAIDCLHRMQALGKDQYFMFYNRLVAAYAVLPKYKEQATQLYQSLLKNPDDLIAFWGYALDELKDEHFDIGFEYYNRRFECSSLNNAYCYNFPYPLWDGEFKQGQTIVFHGEQGLGDEMMFSSPMPEIIAEAEQQGAHIIIGCKPPLVRLMQYSFPQAKVIAHTYDKPAQEIAQFPVDAQMPLGHLLHRNRKSMADFDNNRRPFFKAEPAAIAHFNERIKIQGRESIDGKRRFRVGLMWGTVPSEAVTRFVRNASQKSIPLTMFASFADFIDDVEFISLQNHDRGHETALVPQLQMVDFRHDQADFFDTAAIIENCDLVISVCTSVSHLAGGLEAETWVPLMFTPDWRHGDKRETSYWYNNTRYFHQPARLNWYPTMVEMHEALRERIKKHHQSLAN